MPWSVFVTDILYNWISQFKLSCTNVWRNSFSKLLLERFWQIWPWWPWPLTPKLIGFLCYPGWVCGPSLRRVGSRHSRIIEQKRFWHIWPWWPWPLTPVSIGFLCYPRWMCGPSLRKVGQGVLKLLIGNEKVTDWPIDMCKAISSRRGA